jgi:hypothetical protein
MEKFGIKPSVEDVGLLRGSFQKPNWQAKDSQGITVRDRLAFKSNLPYLAIDLFAVSALY